MTKQFVCDVCGNPYELDEPHIELTVQEGLTGPAPDGSYDVCSWLCMYDLTLAAADIADPRAADQEEETDPSILAMRAVLEADEIGEAEELRTKRTVRDGGGEQIVIVDTPRAKYAKEVEDAGVGVYFPEGMRVDGRPAEQVRRQVPKVRLVRDDD